MPHQIQPHQAGGHMGDYELAERKDFCVSVNGPQDNTFSGAWNCKAHLLRYIKILFPNMCIMALRGLDRRQYDSPAVCVIA